MKIKIGDTKALGSSPLREPCKTGRVLGGNYGRGNVTIMIKGMFGSKTFINKEVLKQALLQNKEYFLKEMGIVISEEGFEPLVLGGDVEFQIHEPEEVMPEAITSFEEKEFKTTEYNPSEDELEELEKEYSIDE